jgi:hypothetical protein
VISAVASLAHYGPLVGLLTIAGAFGLTVESWLQRQDLRALNFQYEILCAQMELSDSYD